MVLSAAQIEVIKIVSISSLIIVAYIISCMILYTFIGIHFFKRKKENVLEDFNELNDKGKNKWSFIGILSVGVVAFLLPYSIYAGFKAGLTNNESMMDTLILPFFQNKILLIIFLVYTISILFLINYLEKKFEMNNYK
ncbi:hypothetical protein C0585_02485 [Candidatus Woesearchaeota archaeon]|nr:MAG: hypothetical protein C0585_02485 [Candidatus Woesearchaeota archaeon]